MNILKATEGEESKTEENSFLFGMILKVVEANYLYGRMDDIFEIIQIMTLIPLN